MADVGTRAVTQAVRLASGGSSGRAIGRAIRGLWVAAFLSLCGMATVLADDDARALLERMVSEGGHVSFRGTMVHMCGGKVDVISVVHRYEKGGVTERVKTLDGDGREIIRKPGESMCIMPDQKLVMVGDGGERHTDRLLAPVPNFASANPANYRISMLGEAHVAGQVAKIVAINPADEYRYGYRLWLHRDHAMALKYELIARDGSALEQTLFTEIEFPEHIRGSDVEPTIVTDGYTWEHVDAVTESDAQTRTGQGWGATDMPAGFDLVRAESLPAVTGTMEHLVYSDGLAAVSVFVEAGVDEAEQSQGRSELGAVNAYTTLVDGHLVTAVGDVPMVTAKMIAMSVAPLPAVD